MSAGSSPASGSESSLARRSRRRIPVIAIGALLAIGVAGAIIAQGPRDTQDPGPTTAPYTRPADWSPLRPAVHLTPPDAWMNDPQRPFWLDGRWHFYYLYNADHPDGNGTEWFHVTSTDLVHWEDEGVAITKYTNGLGDIETGSAVVDVDDTAGFGENAVIAVLTQQGDGVQRQSLFVSQDGGYSFAPIDANPVLDNPGVDDFRDPKIFWDDERGHWAMVLAEGSKLGFYTSPDLRGWTYLSSFVRDDLGMLECPDLFPMSLDGDPSRVRWVLLAGANGAEHGMSTGTAYWIGDWNGSEFTPDSEEPQWLDRGSDLYATVTWDDPRVAPEERLAKRYAIGWLNNWAYARELPADDWQGGSQSVVREITMRTSDDGRPRLESVPADALVALEGDAESADVPETLAAGSQIRIDDPQAVAYRLRIELAPASAQQEAQSEARIHLKDGGGSFATVGVDFGAARVFVARDSDAAARSLPAAYREIRSAPLRTRPDGSVLLDIIVDAASVEVFANEGEVSLSSVVHGHDGANGIRLEAVGGSLGIRSLSVTPLKVAAVVRD